MQRTLIFLLFLASPISAGQKFSLPQIQQIQTVAKQIQSCNDQILSFAAYWATLAQNNYTISVNFSSNTVVLTPDQQNDAQTYYQNLKLNCLTTTVNQLP